MTKGFNIKSMKLDRSKSREGVWVDVGGGLKIRIVCMQDSAEYKQHLLQNQKGRRARRAMEQGRIDLEGMQKLTSEGISKYILKDWNLTEEVDGKEVPITFSPAAAIKIFAEAPQFLEIVTEEASNYDNFTISDPESLEADAKNS